MGEGSSRAKNLHRYSHSSSKTFFEEGIEGVVSYAGRLKPNIEIDMKKVAYAIWNTGLMNLEDFRRNAVLKLNSPYTSSIVSTTHHVIQ